MPASKYDWIKLKQEFFESGILEANTFLMGRIGKDKGDSNVAERTKGWTEDKRDWQRKRIEEAQKEADKELVKKMKITLEDLLVSKKLLFQLDSRFLEIYGKQVSGQELKPEELAFLKSYPAKPLDVFTRIQTELGLPSNRQSLETTDVTENFDEYYEEEFKKWLKERK